MMIVMVDDYLVERKAKEFDEMVRRAHAKKYKPPENNSLKLITGEPIEKNGLELIADKYAPFVRNTREGDRRGKKYEKRR